MTSNKKKLFKNFLFKDDVNIQNLFNLSPLIIPFIPSFELTEQRPIYNRACLQSTRKNQIVRKKLDKMLKAITIRSS